MGLERGIVYYFLHQMSEGMHNVSSRKEGLNVRESQLTKAYSNFPGQQ